MHDASARASDIANRALERIDQFHLFGGQKKRLDAAHEAFSELEALGACRETPANVWREACLTGKVLPP